MRHYSCDLCGIDLADDHFIIQIESFRADQEPGDDHLILDVDPLADIERLLDDDPHSAAETAPRPASLRLDLCPRCQQRFFRDPLARHGRRMRFSEN